MSETIYVQYGCGLCAPRGWLNFDSSPSLRLSRIPMLGRAFGGMIPSFPALVRYGDIVRGLPVVGGSCAGVYASHVLEHLSLIDARTALANTFKILRPGGVFRLLVPDLGQLAHDYLVCSEADAALRFMERSMLGRAKRARSPVSRLREAIGSGHHLWMWDHKSLVAECERAGFDCIRPCGFGDAEDPAFTAVEDPIRFEDAVAIEARRPGGKT